MAENFPGGCEGPVETEYGLACWDETKRCKHLGWNDRHYPYCSGQAHDTQKENQTYPWPSAGRYIQNAKPGSDCPYLSKKASQAAG